VCFVVLLAYLAAKVSSYSQEANVARQGAAAQRQQHEGALKRNAELQRDAAMAKSAGRTTLILQGKGKEAAWAAATWGEAEGKSWMRVSAYGLATAPAGKAYHVWVAPKSGEPVQVGELDPDNDGSAFVMAGNLPAVDQAKSAFISLDSEKAKAPEQVLIEAPLPTLKPEMAAAPQQAPAQEIAR
jgi:hypothetical protein